MSWAPAHGRARLNGGDIAPGEVGHIEHQSPGANGAAAAARSERLRLVPILPWSRAAPRPDLG